MIKGNLKKRFILLAFLYYSPSLKKVRERTQGRNLEAGTEAEAIEEHCLLACSCLAQPIFFYIAHNRLYIRNSSTSIIKQEICSIIGLPIV